MRRTGVAVGLLVSGLFVWLALRQVDFGRVGTSFRAASYWWLAPSLVALAVATAVRAVRWRSLFDPASRPALRPVAHAMLIGLFFNAILPARAGEAARILALWREAGTSRAETLATVVAERLYDVVALLLLLFLAAPFLPEESWLTEAAIAAGAVAVSILAVVLALIRWQERPLLFVVRRLSRTGLVPIERGELAASNLVAGLASLRRPALALPSFGLTVASWLLLGLSAWFLLLGFDLGDTGYGAGLLVVIATSLSLVLPGAPGGVGQFEAAGIVALSVFGIDRSRALSYGVMLHVVNLVPYLLVGYFVLERHAAATRRRRA